MAFEYGGDDYIDSRDLIKRMEELNDTYESLNDQVDFMAEIVNDYAEQIEEFENEGDELPEELWDRAEQADVDHKLALEALDEFVTSEEYDELQELIRVDKECSLYAPEWEDGVTLINIDKFTEYTQQYARDIGVASDDETWPYTCINWDEAADELAMDYTTVEFYGTTYLYR